MTKDPSHPQARPVFATTVWTKVLEARGASEPAREALGRLCASYYAPVHAFIRYNVRDPNQARDVTHEFFARLLAGAGIDSIDPERGRFRSFLLGAVKHFLADQRDHDGRIKRGAGLQFESLDAPSEGETPPEYPDPKSPDPEREFDRKWALTVLDRALASLSREHEGTGRREQFALLKPALTNESRLSHAAVASQLGMNEGAVKVAVHRLRRRFRDLMKAEIAETLRDPSQVEEELACLLEALR